MYGTNRQESIVDNLYIIEKITQDWSDKVEYLIRLPYKSSRMKDRAEIWYRTYCILSNDEFKIIYKDLFE